MAYRASNVKRLQQTRPNTAAAPITPSPQSGTQIKTPTVGGLFNAPMNQEGLRTNQMIGNMGDSLFQAGQAAMKKRKAAEQLFKITNLQGSFQIAAQNAIEEVKAASINEGLDPDLWEGTLQQKLAAIQADLTNKAGNDPAVRAGLNKAIQTWTSTNYPKFSALAFKVGQQKKTQDYFAQQKTLLENSPSDDIPRLIQDWEEQASLLKELGIMDDASEKLDAMLQEYAQTQILDNASIEELKRLKIDPAYSWIDKKKIADHLKDKEAVFASDIKFIEAEIASKKEETKVLERQMARNVKARYMSGEQFSPVKAVRDKLVADTNYIYDIGALTFAQMNALRETKRPNPTEKREAFISKYMDRVIALKPQDYLYRKDGGVKETGRLDSLRKAVNLYYDYRESQGWDSDGKTSEKVSFLTKRGVGLEVAIPIVKTVDGPDQGPNPFDLYKRNQGEVAELERVKGNLEIGERDEPFSELEQQANKELLDSIGAQDQTSEDRSRELEDAEWEHATAKKEKEIIQEDYEGKIKPPVGWDEKGEVWGSTLDRQKQGIQEVEDQEFSGGSSRAVAEAAQDPFGEDRYDYKSARDAGLGPDETGHWPSRVPSTGLILKAEDHPTFHKTLQAEMAAGYEITRGEDGRLYSFPTTREASELVKEEGEAKEDVEENYQGFINPKQSQAPRELPEIQIEDLAKQIIKEKDFELSPDHLGPDKKLGLSKEAQTEKAARVYIREQLKANPMAFDRIVKDGSVVLNKDFEGVDYDKVTSNYDLSRKEQALLGGRRKKLLGQPPAPSKNQILGWADESQTGLNIARFNRAVTMPDVVKAILEIETSGGKEYKAESEAGAVGLMQIMPGTAALIAKQTEWTKEQILNDPYVNVLAGVWLLRDNFKNAKALSARQLRSKTKATDEQAFWMAIAGYNSKPSRVLANVQKKGKDVEKFILGDFADETKDYLRKVNRLLDLGKRLGKLSKGG